jgi:hypothetical protein
LLLLSQRCKPEKMAAAGQVKRTRIIHAHCIVVTGLLSYRLQLSWGLKACKNLPFLLGI